MRLYHCSLSLVVPLLAIITVSIDMTMTTTNIINNIITINNISDRTLSMWKEGPEGFCRGYEKF